MRENAHIIKRCYTGRQVTVTIPKHIAQALGIFSDGYVAFRVNAAGVIEMHPHPTNGEHYASIPTRDLLDRPAAEPSSR